MMFMLYSLRQDEAEGKKEGRQHSRSFGHSRHSKERHSRPHPVRRKKESRERDSSNGRQWHAGTARTHGREEQLAWL